MMIYILGVSSSQYTDRWEGPSPIVRPGCAGGGVMSPRPRTVSDDDILAATGRALQRASPAQLTLADVAAEAGLPPATPLPRFGSKRGLLLALAAQAPNA